MALLKPIQSPPGYLRYFNDHSIESIYLTGVSHMPFLVQYGNSKETNMRDWLCVYNYFATTNSPIFLLQLQHRTSNKDASMHLIKSD